MSLLATLLIGIFLPLFPLSIGFNHLLGRLNQPSLKIALLLLWPLLGVTAFALLDKKLPPWIPPWAAFTALLYAFRLLTQRNIHGWIGFLATSSWSLLWFPLLSYGPGNTTFVAVAVLMISVPLWLLVMLAAELKQRYGEAYTHLYGGLATTMPRFSGLLAFTILAAIATPLFPGFFIMLKMLAWAISHDSLLLAGILLLTWLSWSWAGVRLLQGLLTGPADRQHPAPDLPRGRSLLLALLLVALLASGLLLTGDMS